MARSSRFWRAKDCILLLCLSGAIAGSAHFWITDRLGVLRAVYPAQALIAQTSVECDEDSPGWMHQVIAQAIVANGATANQLAYIAPDGKLSTCESGWQGSILRSTLVEPGTRFRYASLTKLFTADAALSLVRDGHLHLDTRLLDVFPDLVPVSDQRLTGVTIKMLLRHTAGFDRLLTEDPLFSHRGDPWCPYDLAALKNVKLDHDPDTKYSYSNVGYCLLGQVVRRTTNQSFREFLNANYALRSQGVQFVDGPYKKDEVRYDFRNSEFYDENYSRFFDFYALSSSAGLSGSASALARSLREMLVHDINITSGEILPDCDISVHRNCFAYAGYKYRHNGEEFSVHIHEGYLPGASSVTFIGSDGGVLVLLSAGRSPGGSSKRLELHERIYWFLKDKG